MLILAPMQGLTELLFRRAYHQCYPGAFDYAISPFISLTHGNLADAEKKIGDVLPQRNEGFMPVVPQLLGHEPAEFVMLSNRLYELGFNEINWNIGCPMRRVAGKHRGSGILPYPDEVRRLLDTVVPQLRPRLSVKMRLGYRDCHEIDHIIPILNDFPLKSVTIHPRIGKQMYGGIPDLERFAAVLPQLVHPVIYNGDICTVYDYGKIRTRFPQVRDVMIGRGVLYNPLLPMQIRKSYPSDFNHQSGGGKEYGKATTGTICSVADFIVYMAQEIMALDANKQVKIRKLKEYWCLFSRAVPGSEQEKRRVLHATTAEDTFALILEMTK